MPAEWTGPINNGKEKEKGIFLYLFNGNIVALLPVKNFFRDFCKNSVNLLHLRKKNEKSNYLSNFDNFHVLWL